MERLGKSEILLSHSSSPLVSPFIIFPFLPVPPSTADIPIPKDVTRCHPAARASAWLRLCQPRAGLLPLWWLVSPEAGAKPACSTAPPPPAACSGASDIKPHPVAVWLLEVRAVCPSSTELQNSTKLITAGAGSDCCAFRAGHHSSGPPSAAPQLAAEAQGHKAPRNITRRDLPPSRGT